MKPERERRVSTIAIVLGLIFVGFELRQNTASIRGATMPAISDTHINWITQLSLDPKISEMLQMKQRSSRAGTLGR